MARDMDFSARRRSIETSAQPTPKRVVATVPTAPMPSRPPRAAKSGLPAWLSWVLIAALLLVAAFAAYQYFKAASVSQQAVPATAIATPKADEPAVPATNSLVATKNSLPSVQVYDSGAGPDAVTKLVSNLKGLGYATENKDKSQFTYSKTYIWYITGLLGEAQKIQSTMSDRTVELKESKSAGSFEIMVLLGTK